MMGLQASGRDCSGDTPGPRVLVLEDEEDVRDLWMDTLTKAGYTAVGHAAGPDALRCLADVNPAVIISDVVMPKMDGIEFLGQLRADPAWAQIPVLFVSALASGVADALDAPRARELGVAGILPKRIDLTALIDHVRRIVVGPRAHPGWASVAEA